MSKKLFNICFLCAVALCSHMAWGKDFDNGLRHRLDQLLLMQPTYHIGMQVISQRTGAVLYQHNAQHFMTSASTQKLFTAVGALRSLGETFTFDTKIDADGPLVNGVLSGPVWIRFSGDPVFTRKDLNQLLLALKGLGVQRIAGDIVILPAYPNPHAYGPGWMWDELDDCYAAPLSEVMLDRNCFVAHIKPGRVGHSAVINTDFKGHSGIINDVITLSGHPVSRCVQIMDIDDRAHYHIRGCIGHEESALRLKIALRDPLQAVQWQIKQWLHQAHIQLDGHVTVGMAKRLYHAGKVVHRIHSSPAVGALVTTMLQESDNLIADALFTQMGLHVYGEKSWTSGEQALYQVLPEFSASLPELSLRDGAGLSHYNSVSAENLSQLMQIIAKDQALHRIIMPALLAVDYSQPTRHKYKQAKGMKALVIAKTGWMSGISSVAGRIKRADQDHWLFAVIMNGSSTAGLNALSSSAFNFHRVEDQLLRTMAAYT